MKETTQPPGAKLATFNSRGDYALPDSVAQPTLVTYRSIGIGLFGAAMRFTGMPLEKIALFMNSSQVSGANPFGQAIRLTFKEGWLTPYRVVGPASLTAWFLQYSVMGVAFQFFDQALSRVLGVRCIYYGKELMEPPSWSIDDDSTSFDQQFKSTVKILVTPVLAASLESFVSNRAEVQRYFGPQRFAQLEQSMAVKNFLVRAGGPAFLANTMRNVIMCNTSFILTPLTYKFYFPQEHKSKSTLFWYGLSINIFVGNVFAITQQALWGRSLDYMAKHGSVNYTRVIVEGVNKDGLSAFFTGPKWFSRVLMNAPAQGTLPWFYNEILPMGEGTVLKLVKSLIYVPFLAPDDEVTAEAPPAVVLQRRRSNLGSLPTAHSEFRASSPR